MIEHINLIRNVGQFVSVNPSENLSITPFSLIYAENGRGKTTLAAILRSLAIGDVALVNERRRLGSQYPPHIVINHNSEQFVFQNGTWTNTVPEIVIFDDAFVAANVCSGIYLGTSHRQNLHELILGAEGVALNTELQGYITRIERHNADLREKGEAILAIARWPLTILAIARGPLTVNAFCTLESDPDIDTKIQDAERRLAAAKSADAIRQRSGFISITLPDFNTEAVDEVLGKTLANLEADAATRVREHLSKLGQDGEVWIADGMQLIESASERQDTEICPFCAQELQESELIDHYQAYFSEAYGTLKTTIRQMGISVRDMHGGDIQAAFERIIRTTSQNREFWKEFTEIPDITVDTAAIAREWTAARDAVLELLRAKAASPLETIAHTQDALDAIMVYRVRITEIAILSDNLLACNSHLDVVKEQVEADNLLALTDGLNKLNVRKQRFDQAIAPLCEAYIAEKEAKKDTENQRAAARTALDQYRGQIFPTYETAINKYLGRFNALFRLDKVSSVNMRAGSSASYCVVINEQNVNITSEDGPSFHNTLSAGDRNTLALAFFFASLDQDPGRAQKIVVIDDPMTSLDDHRTLKTIEEMRGLYTQVSQMIVLSHSKPFLCALWEGADKNTRSSIRISRTAVGSELAEWDVRNDSITEHDKRHERIARYLQASNPATERTIAQDLRPVLEAFLRVAYPSSFPPGTLLGPFIGVCQQKHGTVNEILSLHDTNELSALLNYANRFHHDSNSAWETEVINDSELVDFARRTLLFASRR